MGLKAEGVQKAFESLNNPKLLDELRKATRGTVDDLTLMQSAVRADKFKIPLQELSKYLKFAQIRARETGQSVEFLANSIVDGIGRKSPLILDNLGLSASELSDEFKKTGDFAKAAGNIISREMAKGGAQINLTSDKVDQLRTAFQNFQVKIGTVLVKVAGQIADIFEVKGDSPLQQTIKGLEQTRDGLLLNLKALENTNLSQKARNQLISETNRLYGPYLKNIDLEKASSEDLVRIQKELNTQFRAKIAQVAFEAELADILKLQATAAQGQLNVEIQRAKLEANRLNLTKQEIEFQENLIRIAEEYNKQVLDESDTKVKQLNESFTKLLGSLGVTLDQITNFGVEAAISNRSIENLISSLNNLSAQTLPQTDVQLAKVSGTIKQTTSDTNIGNTALEKRAEAAQVFTGAISDSFSTLSQLAKEGSAEQLALAIVSILANQAQALASAIAAASQAGVFTGAAAPFAIPAFIASLTGVILGSFAGVFSTIKQAQSAQAQLAEGEIDVHRPGEKKGKDSISALLMPGESVMTTDETKKYKPFLKAIRSGSLEDLIRVNYVDPALAAAGLEYAITDSRQMPDYSERLYRQLLEEKENNHWNKRIYAKLSEKQKGRWRH